MMTEQQKTLKSDDLQERWKNCVLTTCYAYKFLERVKEVVEDMLDAVRQVVNSLVEAFKPVVDRLSLVIDSLVEYIENEDFHVDIYTYPHSYPQIVHSLKIDTKGFPSPILKCARSRC